MVFSSHLFLFYFLPVALGAYYSLTLRWRHLGLTILSYIFYGWAEPRFAALLFATTVVDYIVALTIAGTRPWDTGPVSMPAVGERRTARQRWAMTASICSNLSVLGFFKYFNFAYETYRRLAGALGVGTVDHATLYIVLPLGISFYTFQSLSYTIDVYRGKARATRNFIDLACFVSMFPQLVAGPIVRYADLADQMAHRRHTPEKFARGVAFVAMGLAKKVLLANPCGKVADTLFAVHGLHAADSWYGALAYSFQIYFDFSGYSDMAIGLGLMLGFALAKNFDSPYRAVSITDFWRRWHQSLSTWLRDYLYIPLGGNRRGAGRTYLNIAVVMLLGGLWHGAAWTFVVWGAIHGAMLIVERLYRAMGLGGASDAADRPSGLPRALRILITFTAVTIAWVFFRSPDLHSAVSYCRGMFGLGQVSASAVLARGVIFQPYYLLTMLLAAVIVFSAPQTWDFTRALRPWKLAWAFGLLWISLMVLATQAYNPFIYFIF